MNGLVIVRFSDDDTACAFLQYNYAVTVVFYPQDITDFYIFKSKAASADGPGRQTAKGCIAEQEGEGSTAYAAVCSIYSSAFPDIGIAKTAIASVRRKIRPGHSFGILFL